MQTLTQEDFFINLMDEEYIRKLSKALNEPNWILERRIQAYQNFLQLPYDERIIYAKYTDFSKYNLKHLQYTFHEPLSKEALPKIEELTASIDKEKEIFAIMYEDQLVMTNIPSTLRDNGIVLTDYKNILHQQTFLEQFKDRIDEIFSQTEKSKFTAYNFAFFTNGLFLYVPEGLYSLPPFRLIHLKENNTNSTIIQDFIVVKNSSINCLQEFYTFSVNAAENAQSVGTDSKSPVKNLMSIVTGLTLSNNGEANVGTLQNLSDDVFLLENRFSYVYEDSRLSWALVDIGASFARHVLDYYMKGRGSEITDLSVVLGHKEQKYDIASTLYHEALHTSGLIDNKIILAQHSHAVFKGLARIPSAGAYASSNLSGYALLLDKTAHADVIPALDIDTNEVRAGHAAAVAPIDEEQIFYLKARGIHENDAKRLIIEGFMESVIRQIPYLPVKNLLMIYLDQKLDHLVYKSAPPTFSTLLPLVNQIKA